MNEKTVEKDPIVTLAAIDIGFALLLDNIKQHQPDLSASLSMDMLTTMQEIQKRLPQPQASAVADVLDKWRGMLIGEPKHPTHDGH